MINFNFTRFAPPLLQFLFNKKGSPKLFNTQKFSTHVAMKRSQRHTVKFLVALVPVTAIGASYYYYNSKKNSQELAKALSPTLLKYKPEVQIARSVGEKNGFNLNLILFQYPTCPFCCKVRAFLDYYGLAYDVVEVDPVLRQQTSWTYYKKVPILLAKVQEGYQQLNDSTLIISALKSYLLNKNLNLKDIIDYYPLLEYKEKNGSLKYDIMNKYFLMYHDKLPENKIAEVILEEKQWRQWADNNLVHTLSPNVYRTLEEALQAFKWFSEVGEWDQLFPAWEKNLIIYVGAFAMWLISKNLKKRHKLKDDVRESLYDCCRMWIKVILEKKTTFLGGNAPNLADLAVYGVLSSIEGCVTFKDLLDNTEVGTWYFPMKKAVSNHMGKKEHF